MNRKSTSIKRFRGVFAALRAFMAGDLYEMLGMLHKWDEAEEAERAGKGAGRHTGGAR